LLAHDRWKLEAQFAHEIKLEELRLASRGGSRGSFKYPDSPSAFSEEDRTFNELTSYGAGSDKHIGLIAKTKVWEGAADRSSELLERWYAHLQKNNVIPLKDSKEGRIKTLLVVFLWASGCSHRATKWPDASDSNMIESIQKELKTRFSKFSKHSIIAAYESLKSFWNEINNNELCSFNSTYLSSILDEAYEYVNQQTQKESKVDIKKSPLFSEFEKNFPYVSLDLLERCYIKNRYNFVSGGVAALRRVFTTTCPTELEHKFSPGEWPKKWHQYITTYEPKWQKQLTQIQQETKEAHKAWKEAG
jgi:hypothetical protein